MRETGETGRQDTSLLHLSSLTLKARLVILLCCRCQFVFNGENISVEAHGYSYYILQLQLAVGGLTFLCHTTSQSFQAKFNTQGTLLDSFSYSVLLVEDGRPPEAAEVQGDL